MTFEDITAYGFLVGIAMIVIGTILLAAFPPPRLEGPEADQESALQILAKALAEAFTKFVSVVAAMVSSERSYRPGQYFVAVGFLLMLLCGLLWIIGQLV